MRCPQVVTARQVIAGAHTRIKTGDGPWVPARPYGGRVGIFYRLKLAWKVLVADYDALDWEDRYLGPWGLMGDYDPESWAKRDTSKIEEGEVR